MSDDRTYTLVVSCPDRVGIVAAVSAFVAGHKGWILESNYHADRGSYPEVLDDVVEKRYLRVIPVDPIAGDAWTLIPPPVPAQASVPATPTSLPAAAPTGIYDVRSGASGTTRDGQPYQNL